MTIVYSGHKLQIVSYFVFTGINIETSKSCQESIFDLTPTDRDRDF